MLEKLLFMAFGAVILLLVHTIRQLHQRVVIELALQDILDPDEKEP